MAALLCKSPGLLVADHSGSIMIKLQQLRQFGFDGPQLLQLVIADPNVLSLSTTSLQLKWQYLTEEMSLGKQHVLQQCPTYFSKALIGEVGPRHSFVLEHKLQAAVQCGSSGQQAQDCEAAMQQQQQPPVQTLHLGVLLDPSIPEFLTLLGKADAAAEFAAHGQLWQQTEGLKWAAIRVT